jgi:hypothetical protein
MKNDLPKDAYRDAYKQASSDLQKIFGEVERLQIRKDRVAKLIEVLNRRFGFQAKLALEPITIRSEQEGLKVATRLTIVQTRPQAED